MLKWLQRGPNEANMPPPLTTEDPLAVIQFDGQKNRKRKKSKVKTSSEEVYSVNR